jgi:hypothetical protein
MWQAEIVEEQAEKFRLHPTLGLSEAAVQNIVKRYKERANVMRAEAARMQAAGVDAYPVAAGRMQLNFGNQACDVNDWQEAAFGSAKN